MSVIPLKFLQSAFRSNKSSFLRFLSTSQFKLNESDVEEIRIPVPWGHIAGKWWGDKEVPPVLAIHGWQDNANTYDRLIPHLNVPSVLALDLPGHGLSSHLLEGRTYDFAEHIITLHRIKKYFNWTQMPLLTHSLGGVLGYAYTSIFPDQVKWFINFECGRTLCTLIRTDIHSNMSQGIDATLKIEEMKKNRSPPAYKLSKMIEMSIEGSLGSVASPEAALILLKRGIIEVEKPTGRSNYKFHSGLEEFVTSEKKALLLLPKEEREYITGFFLDLEEHLRKGKEKLKGFHLDADDKYYIFKRDPSLKVSIFQSVDEDFIIEASKRIKCPVLSVRAKQGFLFGSTRKLYEKTVENLKISSNYLEHHDVDGTHHAHLNTPETLAPIMNNFIEKCEMLKN